MPNFLWDLLNLPPTKADTRAVRSTVTEVSAAEINTITSALEDLRTAHLDGEIRDRSTSLPASGAVRARSQSGKLEISEGGRWRRPNKGDRVYDIREPLVSNADGVTIVPGALPGQANKARTRLAIQNIFDTIKHRYADQTPAQTGKSAVVLFPYDADGWWVDAGLTYQGSVSVGIVIQGEHSQARGGQDGTSLIYDGPTGDTTLLDCIAMNGSEIRNMCFNGNEKARKLLWLRQKVVAGAQVGPSSGVNVFNCFFNNPAGHEDSILVAAGKDDIPGSTLQSSEYRFFNCYFQGHNNLAPQGWGFKALSSGNTKNFVFSHCIFNDLYIGAEAGSGYVFINECNGGNIGGRGRPGASMFQAGGNTWTILGGGLENGEAGYASRFVSVGQLTKVIMIGCYIAATTYADDYAVTSGGALTIMGCDFEGNSRGGAPAWAASTAYVVGDRRRNGDSVYEVTTAGTSAASGGPTGQNSSITDGTVVWKYLTRNNMIEWTASTAYVVGEERFNGARAYRCITAGTSAASGGPTGTATDITDGTAHWEYKASAVANIQKIQSTLSGDGDTSAWGGCDINGANWRYTHTRVYSAPVFDGSNNHIAGSPFTVASGDPSGDFGRSTAHKVRVFGCSEGKVGQNVEQSIQDWQGTRVISGQDQFWRDYLDAPGSTVIRNNGGVYAVRVPYNAIQANGNGDASQRIIRLGDAPKGCMIEGAMFVLETLFTGPAGTITAELGCVDTAFARDDDRLLKVFDLKAGTVPVRWGIADAHLGVLLASATRETSRGSFISWRAGSEEVDLVIKAAGGGIPNMTAGSLLVYVFYKRMN